MKPALLTFPTGCNLDFMPDADNGGRSAHFRADGETIY